MPAFILPRRAVHLDFHTMPGVPDVGRDFDPEEFAHTLQQAHVDYITVFARCNLGFCYYPSQVGIPHPGLQQELLGPMVEACHRRGIRVAAYINAGIDHEHALRHRGWCKLNKRGQVYQLDRMGHFFRDLCLNTGYGDHLLSLVEEVLARYPVDGLFLDCFDLNPCYGVECVEGMAALDMDVSDDDQVAAYCRQITYEFLGRVTQRARRAREDIGLCFNGIPYAEQPTHIEIEALPTGGWGYDYLPAATRYSRALGKPFFTMTGRFHESWGDFGGLRTEHSLLYDCLTSLAQGGACSVGDHMHPRGRLDPEVYRLIGRVYSRVREIEPWLEKARPAADIVVLDPRLREMPRSLNASVRGACRMLEELHCQFDLSDGEQKLSPYRVVVLPDSVALTDALHRKLKEHLASGGAVLSSGRSGLAEQGDHLALAGHAVACSGPEPRHPTFFTPEPQIAEGLPEALTTIYEPGVALSVGAGVEVLARLYHPYFDHGSWDWRHENLYTPPDRDSGRPAVLRCGDLIHVSFPIFSSYFEHSPVAYRTLVRNCLRLLLPEPLLEVSRLPSFGRAAVAVGDGLALVHLLTYVPELRGARMQMIEEPVLARDIGVSLRMDGRRATQVMLALSGEALGFAPDGDFVRFTVPEICGYQLVVVNCRSAAPTPPAGAGHQGERPRAVTGPVRTQRAEEGS